MPESFDGIKRSFLAVCAAFLAMAFPLGAPASAQSGSLPPPEKVPTFLGIDLPLRPGERLLHLGNSGCSMVVFAPKPEHFETYRNLMGEYEWSGACRFGLIHGNGKLLSVDGWLAHDFSAIYGVQYFPARDKDSSGFSFFISAYAGVAFSDLSFKSIVLSASDVFDDLDSFEKASGNTFSIQTSAFDTEANPRTVWVRSEDVSYACANEYQDLYKPFEKEVKRVCSRSQAGQFVVHRRQGTAVFHYENPIVWLKACPLKKGSSEADCSALMREALGEHYSEIEVTFEGSPAARPEMIQEVLNRYAPLEAAVEARLKDKVSAGGAQ